mmetsp:Transcript_15451/g.49468  ORF Transcript_15451/g.49468 Transcript_15451/m.49468 type:complete len:207 (-) Transcript_15451:1142-1762(-)
MRACEQRSGQGSEGANEQGCAGAWPQSARVAVISSAVNTWQAFSTSGRFTFISWSLMTSLLGAVAIFAAICLSSSARCCSRKPRRASSRCRSRSSWLLTSISWASRCFLLCSATSCFFDCFSFICSTWTACVCCRRRAKWSRSARSRSASRRLLAARSASALAAMASSSLLRSAACSAAMTERASRCSSSFSCESLDAWSRIARIL